AVRSAAEHPAAVRSAAGRTDTDGHDAKPGKPIVSTFLAVEGVPDELAVPDAGSGTPGRGSIPSYPSPERAVLALARAHRYARWRATPQGALVRPDGIDSSAARDLVSTLCTPPHGEPTRVSDADTVRLLDHYGIPIVPFDRADDVDAAVAAADRLGYPVAVKAADDRRAGTGDLSMVRLDLADADAVRRAYPAVVDASGGDAVIVQRMAAPGVSCVVGLVDDPSFGSLVYFGLAGVISDLVGDRAYRAVPLTDVDARWLVRAPKAAPLLSGYRGAEPADLDALAQLLLRVSALADDLPQVRSLELDPVLAGPHTVAVTNARMRLGPPLPPTDTLPRRLFSFEDLR
ncbi:MAG: acetate--CoA ligase family protein, partial [Sciscionella sp.]|nr:acetate--CoA ligase family protein [Sciscionella sp.]